MPLTTSIFQSPNFQGFSISNKKIVPSKLLKWNPLGIYCHKALNNIKGLQGFGIVIKAPILQTD